MAASWWNRLALVCAVSCFGVVACAADPPPRPNVMLIVVDDLRPHLSCYGYRAIPTPNIDRLSREGVRFERAYCQIPSCSPSRSSFLTGLRPDIVKVYDNSNHFREAVPEVVTLPQYFRQSGYHTVSLGKVFHGIFTRNRIDDPPSWSEPEWRTPATQYATTKSLDVLRNMYPKDFRTPEVAAGAMATKRYKGPAWEAPDVPDTALTDGRTAAKAVEKLAELSQLSKPFFLAVGFAKPHAPFVSPKRYHEFVDRRRIKPLRFPSLPEGTTSLAATSRELFGYHGVPSLDVLPREKQVEYTAAYDACVAYIDAQVGVVLDELDRQGLRDNTVVVLMSDHGYHLGELGQWCKNTNFEESLRVPLIVSAPGQRSDSDTRGLVGLIDLYPTLAELCGLDIPTGLHGESFGRLVRRGDASGREYVFSQHTANLRDINAPVGYSVRTPALRYTEWFSPDGSSVASELYCLQHGRTATSNLVEKPGFEEQAVKLHQVVVEYRAGKRR